MDGRQIDETYELSMKIVNANRRKRMSEGMSRRADAEMAKEIDQRIAGLTKEQAATRAQAMYGNDVKPSAQEYTGGSVSYYTVTVTNATSGCDVYTAECNDIIEALKMNYAEGNAFKAIWRSCAARNLGKAKAGYKDGQYDAEKVVFFGQRMVKQARAK